MTVEFPHLAPNVSYSELDSMAKCAVDVECRQIASERPIIAISGYGGAGKDTLAQMLKDQFKLNYDHSTSYCACHTMFRQIENGYFDQDMTPGDDFLWPHRLSHFQYIRDQRLLPDTSELGTDISDPEQWYKVRSKYREFWAAWIHCWNYTSPLGIQLYLDHIKMGQQILTGVRQKEEMERLLNYRIIDFTIWLHNPNVSEHDDPTMEYDESYADIIIWNNGSQDDLANKVKKLYLIANNVFKNRPIVVPVVS